MSVYIKIMSVYYYYYTIYAQVNKPKHIQESRYMFFEIDK